MTVKNISFEVFNFCYFLLIKPKLQISLNKNELSNYIFFLCRPSRTSVISKCAKRPADSATRKGRENQISLICTKSSKCMRSEGSQSQRTQIERMEWRNG